MNFHLISYRLYWFVFLVILQTSLCLSNTQAKDEPVKLDPVKLAALTKDVLRSRCFDCHGGNATQGDIAVLNQSSLLSKKMVVPGKPDESPLYRVLVESDEDVRMPQDAPALNQSEIDTIRQWIIAEHQTFLKMSCNQGTRQGR